MAKLKKPVKKAAKKKAVTKKAAKKQPTRKALRKIIKMIDLKEVEPKDYLRVVPLYDNKHSTIIHEILGITKERSKELESIALKCYRTFDTFTQASEELSKSFKHANEFCLGMFMLVTMHERNHRPMPIMIMGGPGGFPPIPPQG